MFLAFPQGSAGNSILLIWREGDLKTRFLAFIVQICGGILGNLIYRFAIVQEYQIKLRREEEENQTS